uniref:Uncharacterized protein n=1 Tax=Arundo donax TaxID=35708 RepID=A0A0A8YM46_ARUDO
MLSPLRATVNNVYYLVLVSNVCLIL